MYLAITVSVHMALLAVSVVFLILMLLRSNRTAFYYSFFWYSISLSGWLMIRMIEILAGDADVQELYIQISIVLTALMIPLVINLMYSLVIRQTMPFIMQMIGGAASLSLIMFAMPYVQEIRDLYQTDFKTAAFLVYLWLPVIFVVLSIPLASIAASQSLFHVSSLPFERIMTNSPDLFILIDRYGWVADYNVPVGIFESCRDRSDLIDILDNRPNTSPDDWRNLKKAILLPHESSNGDIQIDITGQLRWYAWSVKPIIRRSGHRIGSVLLFSDRTHIRQYLTQLNEQNEDLVRLHAELADYENLADRYTEEATRQEVADFIDISVRTRMIQSFEQMFLLKKQDASTSSHFAVQHLLAESRRALSDVRALVKRLSE